MLHVELSGQEPSDVNCDVAICDVEICAVESYDVESCFARGIDYSSGREVEINMVEAHKWFNIAASRGHKEGVQMRREIAALMSDAEIGQAQRAARDWLKLNPLPAMPVQEPLRVAA
jgi:TPR repeat protein